MLNLNKAGKTTDFEIYWPDSFLHVRQAKYVISRTYVQADGSKYLNKFNVQLVDNIILFLFSYIEVLKYGV